MPPQGRLGDKARVPVDAHGCPACPHMCVGPAIVGSPNVNVNSRPAVRVDDMGIHAACCGPNMWTAKMGSATVFINGKAAHRKGDMNQHCGGIGTLIEGSDNVNVGDGGGGGGGGGGSGNTVSGNSTSGSAANTGNSSSNSPGSSASSPSSAAGSDATCGSGAPGEQGAEGTAPNGHPGSDPNTPPAKAPADWKAEFSDGKAVKGFRSLFQTSGGTEEKLTPDGGGHTSHGSYAKGQDYTAAIIGIITVEGKVESATGKPIVGAKVHIDRAYGDSVDLITDGNGTFKAEGFVEQEDYEVTITEPKRTLAGTIEDEEGKPVPNARVFIERSYGDPIEVETDANGQYKADGITEEEEHHVTISAPSKAEARILDEEGKPMAHARLLVQAEGGQVTELETDEDGKFVVEGFAQQPHYALGVIAVKGVAEGRFTDVDGKPKSGVQARILRHAGPPIEITSDGDGNYRAEGLIPGEDYTLEVTEYS